MGRVLQKQACHKQANRWTEADGEKSENVLKGDLQTRREERESKGKNRLKIPVS
jgi:hypothetical protein